MRFITISPINPNLLARAARVYRSKTEPVGVIPLGITDVGEGSKLKMFMQLGRITSKAGK